MTKVLGLTVTSLLTLCALAVSCGTPLSDPALEARARYATLCEQYGGDIDAAGWCRGARPLAPITCPVEIQMEGGEPLRLNLAEGGVTTVPVEGRAASLRLIGPCAAAASESATPRPARCIVQISPAEAEPIKLDLTAGGPERQVYIGDTVIGVRIVAPYGAGAE